MIPEIFFNLSDYQINVVVPATIKILAPCIGKYALITNRQIRNLLDAQDINESDPGMREIIKYIRQKNLLKYVLSNNDGYWISHDETEVRGYIERNEHRAYSILENTNAMARGLLEDYRKKQEMAKSMQMELELTV